jgi:hypothetical protein
MKKITLIILFSIIIIACSSKDDSPMNPPPGVAENFSFDISGVNISDEHFELSHDTSTSASGGFLASGSDYYSTGGNTANLISLIILRDEFRIGEHEVQEPSTSGDSNSVRFYTNFQANNQVSYYSMNGTIVISEIKEEGMSCEIFSGSFDVNMTNSDNPNETVRIIGDLNDMPTKDFFHRNCE